MSDAFIKKLAKKTKIGEYDPKEVVEALNIIDPGWKIQDAVEAMPLRSQSAVNLDRDAVAAVGFSGDKPDVSSYDTDIYIHWSYGSERQKGTRPDEKTVQDAIGEVLRQIKSQVEIAKDPSNPKIGQTYLDKLPKPKIEWDVYSRHGGDWQTTTAHFKLTGAKRGTNVVNIVSPKGEKISLIGKQTRGGSTYFDSPTLWTSLYRMDVADKAKAYLADPDVAAAEARREQLRNVKGDPGNVGTCPVCGRMQKLSWSKKTKDGHPTMVLHGYTRPGYGYIQGNCFGVGYAPFELSPEGTIAWRDHLKGVVSFKKESLTKFRGIKSFTIWTITEWTAPRVEIILKADGTIEPTGKTASSSDLRSAQVKAHHAENVKRDPKGFFDDLKKAGIEAREREIKQLEGHIKELTAAIDGWSAKPLPGTSEEDQKFIAEQKSGQCPGSGTAKHDSSHVGNYMSKWAKCDVCGQTVTVTSTGKMRAHPFVKKAKASASTRIDEVAERLVHLAPITVQASLEEAADVLVHLDD